MNNHNLQTRQQNGFMLLEFLSLLALFAVLVSLTISSWQIQQLRKTLRSRTDDNITLWHLREDASHAQEIIFQSEQPSIPSPCTSNISTSEPDLSLLKCEDKQRNTQFSVLMSRR